MVTPHYADDSVTLYHGDCLEVLRELPDASVDSIVTDPPYNLSFMAKPWDAYDGQEDAGFAYWLTGLIDGEGHFGIKAHARGTHAPHFAIKLRADERGTLERIRRSLGVGTISNERREPNPMVKYVIQDKAGCQRLVDLLDKYPLRAKKQQDYWVWREAVCEWTSRPRGNRWHGRADNTRMADLRTRLMEGRAYTDVPWSGHEFQDWCRLWAAECLRVLKPGGHLLAFGGTRTWHRLACAVEDAGFEIRDSIAWMYGSGFPKSLNVAAAVERHRAAGPSIVRSPDDYSRELLSDEAAFCAWMREHSGLTADSARRLLGSDRFITGEVQIVNTATADNPRWGRRAMVPTVAAWQKIRATLATEPPAWVESLVKSPPQPNGNTPGDEWTPGKGRGVKGDNEWQGWGTALKPAFEPVVVARKPLAGTVAANVLAHGTGALNIDGCRVEGPPSVEGSNSGGKGARDEVGGYGHDRVPIDRSMNAGRWPANVILDESQAAALDEQSGELISGKMQPTHTTAAREVFGQNASGGYTTMETYGDSGGASRFFYVAKAPATERPRVDGVAHPTVKPLDLMRWLVRLVTPPGGTVLEPFAGSGTTAEACVIEGFKCIAVEREADYLPLIIQRLSKPIQVGLDFGSAS